MLNVGSLTAAPCLRCGAAQVKVALATQGVTYYRCIACHHAWSEDRRQKALSHTPERRKAG